MKKLDALQLALISILLSVCLAITGLYINKRNTPKGPDTKIITNGWSKDNVSVWADPETGCQYLRVQPGMRLAPRMINNNVQFGCRK